MIKLKLSFGKDGVEQSFDIVQDELLNAAVERILKDVPLGKFTKEESFVATVNGMMIDKDFWPVTKLNEKDEVIVSPRIGSGDSGQIFKQALIVAISVVATVYLGPAAGGGIYGALAVAAVTVGATLLLNALIPPPVADLGLAGLNGRDIDNSQMYSINGQSNQMRRLGTVPKVYGTHRVYPIVACIPYTELQVDPDTGETVQYLYAIYDLGLGVMRVGDLKIGDTPLTTDSFRDFEYRLVDPNRPDVDRDEFDEPLDSTFSFYKSRRTATPLSLAIADTEEFIQVTDENTEGVPQEIILDFTCPVGLYGFSSSGNLLVRTIKMQIDFAPVGSSDWQAYNDLEHVESYTSVGGKDDRDFTVSLYPSEENATYYQWYQYSTGGYTNPFNTSRNAKRVYSLKRGQKKLLVYDNTGYEVGQKIFHGTIYLGTIASINNAGGPSTELTLDRNIPNREFLAFQQNGYQNTAGGSVNWYPGFSDVKTLRTSKTESGAADIFSDSTSPVYANFKFTPKVPGQFQIRVRRVSTIGSYSKQKGDDLTWTGITTALKIDPIQTTKRHCFIELKIKATNQLNGHIQNLSCVVSSVLPVYDQDTQTWTRQVTNNPAWVFCDLLTGEVNKKSVPVSRLHLPSILEWAAYCEEIPTPPPSADYVEPRFQCNFILDYATTLQNVIGQVCGAAQASLNMIDGRYGVLVDRFKDVPVQIFTPRNSRDFSSTRLYGPRPHGLKVKYIDPELNWDVAELIIYDNGYSAANATDFDDLTSFACTNHEQAWRFGRYMLAQNKLRQETISILVDFEHLVCTRGDYVQITQDVMKVGGTPARVKDVAGNVVTTDGRLDIIPDISYGYTYRAADGNIATSTLTPTAPDTFTLDGDIPAIGDLIVIGEVGKLVYDCVIKSISPNDDISATVVLVEKADAIFDYESTDTLPDYNPEISNTSNPERYPPKAVTDLTVTDNTWTCAPTLSGYAYYIEIIWSVPPGSVYEFFEIWMNDGRGYKSIATTTSTLFRYDVDQERLDREYGFKVVAVSANGNKLQLIAMPEVLTTPHSKTDPPTDVENFSMNITNQVLQLVWDLNDDCDILEYEIRFSPETNDVWEASIPLQRVAKNVNSVSVQARTGVYLIKALDFAGNQSETASAVITSIPNLFDLNVIDTVNDAPAFEGAFDKTVLLGEAVILDTEVAGDPDTAQFYDEGVYEYSTLLDLDDIYTCRLQSLIRADGYKFGELMSDWAHLSDIDSLTTVLSDDWSVSIEYRATDVFLAMSDWEHLSDIDHLNYGTGVGFTSWRPIPTVGDVTGRVFQFRTRLQSFTPNVSPRLFDATIKIDMPDRIDSFENLTSHASLATEISYAQRFRGPGTTPNVQVSIDNAETGDYWEFEEKTLAGLKIRFFDKTDTQVVRQFDLVAKGYGRRHTVTI